MAMHPRYPYHRTGTVLGSKVLGIVASDLNVECDFRVAWTTGVTPYYTE